MQEVAPEPSYKRLGYTSYHIEEGSKKPYLGSKHWQKKTKQLKDWTRKKYGRLECRLCGEYAWIPHHRTYETLEQEEIPRDLVLICGPCHSEIHFQDGGFHTPLIRSALVRRENELYERNRSFSYRFMTARPSDVIDRIGKIIVTAWNIFWWLW